MRSTESLYVPFSVQSAQNIFFAANKHIDNEKSCCQVFLFHTFLPNGSTFTIVSTANTK